MLKIFKLLTYSTLVSIKQELGMARHKFQIKGDGVNEEILEETLALVEAAMIRNE